MLIIYDFAEHICLVNMLPFITRLELPWTPQVHARPEHGVLQHDFRVFQRNLKILMYYTVCGAILCNTEHSDVLLLIVPLTTKNTSEAALQYYFWDIFRKCYALSVPLSHCSVMPLSIKPRVHNKVEMGTALFTSNYTVCVAV